MSARRKGSYVLLLILSVGLLVSAPVSATENTLQPAGPSDYTSWELLSDPELSEMPEVIIAGNSGEFSFDYESDGVDGDLSMTWNHTAGTRLDYPLPTSYRYNETPECNEFIVCRKPFLWERDCLPFRVRISIDYEFEITGSISFQPFVKMITSRGRWVSIYTLFPIRNGTNLASVNSLKCRIDDVWETQTAETPLGAYSLALVVGLSPSESFQRLDNGTEPWRYCNGSVTMTLHRISALALVGERTPVEEISSIAQGFWDHEGDELWSDLHIDSDGSVYGAIMSRPGGYPFENYTPCLVKWGSNREVIWWASLNESSYWFSSDLHGDFIYVMASDWLGPYDPVHYSNYTTLLAKYKTDGTHVWIHRWNFPNGSRGRDVAVGPDGEIYVIASVVESLEPYRYTPVLMKLDQDGKSLWNATFWKYLAGRTSLRVTHDGNVYVQTRRAITKCDRNGNLLWNVTGEFDRMQLTTEGDVYAAYSTFNYPMVSGSSLIRISAEGIVTWNKTVEIVYTEDFSDPLLIESCCVAPDDSLYMVLYSPMDSQLYRLARYDETGRQLWSRSMSEFCSESEYWFHWLIAAGENNLIYVASSTEGADGWRDIGFLVYTDSSFIYWLNIIDLRFVAAVSFVVIFVALDQLRRRRRRGS
jgi:hypothetical protein